MHDCGVYCTHIAEVGGRKGNTGRCGLVLRIAEHKAVPPGVLHHPVILLGEVGDHFAGAGNQPDVEAVAAAAICQLRGVEGRGIGVGGCGAVDLQIWPAGFCSVCVKQTGEGLEYLGLHGQRSVTGQDIGVCVGGKIRKCLRTGVRMRAVHQNQRAACHVGGGEIQRNSIRGRTVRIVGICGICVAAVRTIRRIGCCKFANAHNVFCGCRADEPINFVDQENKTNENEQRSHKASCIQSSARAIAHGISSFPVLLQRRCNQYHVSA